MFTGIIESTACIVSAITNQNLVRILVERPSSFTDIKLGDSIAVNGVCLTIEAITSTTIQFAMGFETLKVLNLSLSPAGFEWSDQLLNLERSLPFGGRVDGHFVTGHVDTRIELKHLEVIGESWVLRFELPTELRPYIWRKGSCALNGVSLTINDVDVDWFSVCLIPETLKRTNFSKIKVGDRVNFEIDMMARAIVHNLKLMLPNGVI